MALEINTAAVLKPLVLIIITLIRFILIQALVKSMQYARDELNI